MPVQVESPPSTLQLPATPPAAVPYPPRNTSTSPVRMSDGGLAISPDGRRGINLRQVGFLQPVGPAHQYIGECPALMCGNQVSCTQVRIACMH